MATLRCLRSGRPRTVVDAHQILGRGDPQHGPDLGDLGSTRCRAALGTERKKPDLARDFGGERRCAVITYRVRIPTIGTNGSLRLRQAEKIINAPIQGAIGQLLDPLLGYGLDDMDAVCRRCRLYCA